jgi:type II secretory pathway component PulK
MNKRGAALIICYMIIAFLSILAGAFLTRSVSERSVASKYFDSTQAFWFLELMAVFRM